MLNRTNTLGDVMLQRVKTGIQGLDDMLQGGIPARRHVALSGGPGCGKTSFSFNFLYAGAKAGENGIYITLEETEDEIIENMKATFVGWNDIDSLVNDHKLIITKPEKMALDSISEIIENAVIEYNVKRFVIDSATMIKMTFDSLREYRQTLYEFFALLRNLDSTGILTVEVEYSKKDMIKYDIEHYVADGVINLYAVQQGEKIVRAVEVMKMRATDHTRGIVPFKILPNGIKVYVGEKVF